jgi:DNA invertase Pin-like site-specific DNA recombinase
MPAMPHYLVYVRRSYVERGAPDVSDEAQVASVLPLLPAGASHEVIADSLVGDGKRKHSGRTDDRDGYRELIRRIAAGGVDGIAVYEIGRLARNARLMLNLKEELDRRAMPILVGVMPNTRFDTAIGRYIFGQLCLAAQLQADLDSERMTGMTRALFEDGRHRGNDPFGYRSQRDPQGRRQLVIVDQEAALVRRVVDELASQSFGAIAELLAGEGCLRRGRPWTADAVKDIWRRARLYLGFVVARRGLEERPGRHEAILEEEAYRSAVAGIAARQHGRRRRSPKRRFYLLAGLLACACGSRLRGETQSKRGHEWRYYRCPRGHGSVPADVAEGDVLEVVRRGVLPAEAIEQAREELRRRLRAPAAGQTGELRVRLLQRRERLAKRFEWGELEEQTYRAERAGVDRQLAQLPDGDKLVRFDQFRAVAVSVAEALDVALPEQRAELVHLLIEAIPVRDRWVDVDAIAWSPPALPFFAGMVRVPPEGFEPPTPALGRRRSIH